MKLTKKLGFSLAALFALLSGCSGSGTGACVSSPVSYYSFTAVYCYSNWDKADCDYNNANDIDGGSPWYFYSGQSCSDRGLTDGSNPI